VVNLVTINRRGQKTMKYKSVVVTRRGSPEVLQIVENDLRAPSAGEVRVKILATPVCRPDITTRNGTSLFSDTLLAPKIPYVPGYAILGIVDAVGEGVTGLGAGDRVGALTVTGGYAEYIFLGKKKLIPVPAALDPAEAVTLILNYVVAYQTLHRSAKVRPGHKVLIIGASGGVGTALLQLGKLADLTMYAIASKSKHPTLTALGAIPIDYHTQDFVEVIRQAEPAGLDAVFDGMSGSYIRRSLSLLRRGGKLVSYGEPPGLLTLLRILATFMLVNLLPNGKTFKLYGTSFYTFNKRPFLEDWAALFKLLEEGKIKPIIMQRFPILEAARANELLESGTVVGNVVLLAPELLQEPHGDRP
jgi:NADPH:quinone reductase-like Zn-dependent oxidoreductase